MVAAIIVFIDTTPRNRDAFLNLISEVTMASMTAKNRSGAANAFISWM